MSPARQQEVLLMGRVPSRIVCLGAELPDIFYRLGALDRVVGISAYTDWPPEALRLPKVSGFRHGRARRILAADPDLVILTSTVQLPIAAELAGQGVPLLHLFPHRLSDMLQSIRLLGALVGQDQAAERLVADAETAIARARTATAAWPRRPRVYFEEWMDPLVAGVGWVSDLIELAGGVDIFRERSLAGRTADQRRVDPSEVLAADPDLILVSWCGEPMQFDRIRSRPGWDRLRAVQTGAVIEVSPAILQCGPRLLDLLPDLTTVVARAASGPAFADPPRDDPSAADRDE
jgi:iron complex transport system substrate-binding protein